MEMQGIEPCTSRMQSERSTIWATSPFWGVLMRFLFYHNIISFIFSFSAFIFYFIWKVNVTFLTWYYNKWMIIFFSQLLWLEGNATCTMAALINFALDFHVVLMANKLSAPFTLILLFLFSLLFNET